MKSNSFIFTIRIPVPLCTCIYSGTRDGACTHVFRYILFYCTLKSLLIRLVNWARCETAKAFSIFLFWWIVLSASGRTVNNVQPIKDLAYCLLFLLLLLLLLLSVTSDRKITEDKRPGRPFVAHPGRQQGRKEGRKIGKATLMIIP